MSSGFNYYRRILPCQLLVLHPSHKDRYFETVGWEEDWIATARDIVRDEFERAYANLDADESESEEPMVRFFFLFMELQAEFVDYCR